MKIYDTFIFNSELDILELRFREIYDYVDKFVIVECPETFQRKPKPMYFWENRERFKPFIDKVIYVVDSETLPPPTLVHGFDFSREIHQREEIKKGLQDCQDDDVILLCDVDEIPDRRVLLACREGNLKIRMRLEMSLHYYYFECIATTWILGCVAPYKVFMENSTQYHRVDMHRKDPRFHNAGWHLSSFGGAEKVAKKIQSLSDVNVNKPPYNTVEHCRRCMSIPKDPMDRGDAPMHIVPREFVTLPETVSKNMDYYEKLGFFREGALKL